jgi:hypothetical protein
MRRALATALGALTLTAPATAAATDAAPGFRLAGQATAPAQADSRYAAWPLADGAVKVLDTSTGRRKNHTAGTGCSFAALGSGRLLWKCGYGNEAEVRELATGKVTRVRFTGGDSSTHFRAVGRHWFHVVVSGNHYGNLSSWVRIATGESRTSAQRQVAGEVEDLDSPGLYRPLCRPLRREADPSYEPDTIGNFGDPYLPYEYEAPYGAHVIGSGRQVLLDRCGRGDQRVIGTGTLDLQLSDGWVTWSKGLRVRGLRPADSRRFDWHLGGLAEQSDRLVRAAHTRRHLFATTEPREHPGVWRVYAARLPR